jgi:type II secretory pathway pseudopilin PulG
VELLVVIVVIALLVGITIVAYNGIQTRAQTSSIESDLANAANQLALYKSGTSTNDTFPTDLSSTSIKSSLGTSLQYIYSSSDNTY